MNRPGAHTHHRHRLAIACGVLALGLALSPAAQAQRYYPRGYGGYGWGGWGNATDPAGGYMAGLGSYARGAGYYEVEDAKARAINLDTMLKWNQALRERQKQLREQQKKEDAQRAAQRKSRVDEAKIDDGTTLNDLMARIYEFDPGAVKSSKARAVLGASAIRAIPFEWDTEAITFCVDEMTARGGLPPSLDNPRFNDEKNALRRAVDAALEEEKRGSVSPATKSRVSSAIAAFRAKFNKEVPQFDPSRQEAEQYFITLASLTRMLNDPSMKQILNELGAAREVRVGDLIAFMHSYNLRFAPATTPEQTRIYHELARVLSDVAQDLSADAPPVRSGGDGPRSLPDAAKDAFKGMQWKHLGEPNDEP